jgi:hypothetical protein
LSALLVALSLLVAGAFPGRAQQSLQLIAPATLLVENFTRVVFGLEFGSFMRERVHKWLGPVRIALIGADADLYRPFVAGHVAMLARLTGLDMRLVEGRDGGENFAVHFVRHAEMFETAARYPVNYRRVQRAVDSSACMYVFYENADMSIGHSIAIISTDRHPRYVTTCILEEMSQALGLPMDTELIHPSIFSDRDLPQSLSINDKILVRTLYDPRIRPGMPQAEALRQARAIIPELIAGVRRYGEAALYRRR